MDTGMSTKAVIQIGGGWPRVSGLTRTLVG